MFAKIRSFFKKSTNSNLNPTSADHSGAENVVLTIRKDPRRYKRAHLYIQDTQSVVRPVQQELASASVQYRGRSFTVIDLSHNGIAIERFEIDDASLPSPQVSESMVVTLGKQEPFALRVSIVRHSDSVLAFEFSEISTEARLAIDRFLDPKMVGLNMRAVESGFFAPGETFSVWYCGPRDTNFFLWMNGKTLGRAIVQLSDVLFTVHQNSDGSVRAEYSGDGSRVMSELRSHVLFALDVAIQLPQRETGSDAYAAAGLVRLLTQAATVLENVKPRV